MLRLPDGLQVYRQDYPRERGQGQIHRRRRGELRLSGRRLRTRQGRRVGLLAGGRGGGLGHGYDGPDALRVAAGALCEVRLLPRGPRVGRTQGQGGRRADSEDDGRIPGKPAQDHRGIARGEDQRLPVARNDRREERCEEPYRAG